MYFAKGFSVYIFLLTRVARFGNCAALIHRDLIADQMRPLFPPFPKEIFRLEPAMMTFDESMCCRYV